MIYSSNVKYEEDAAHIDPASELPFERLFRKQLPSVDMTKRIYDQITKRTWFQSASVHDGAASLMGWFEARYRATMTEDQYLIVLQRVNETIQELYPSRYRPYTLDRKTKGGSRKSPGGSQQEHPADSSGLPADPLHRDTLCSDQGAWFD